MATPAVARTFGAIYDEFKAYRRGILAVGPFTLWTHVFWADAALSKERPPSMAAAPNHPAPITQPQSPSPNHPAPLLSHRRRDEGARGLRAHPTQTAA